MTNPTCCARPMRRVEIKTETSALTLLACLRCENSTWLADGVAVERSEVLTAMSTVGRAPRVAA